MRKLLSVCMVLLFVVLPSSATNLIGLAGGAVFSWAKMNATTGSGNAESRLTETDWYAALHGENYFGRDDALGIGYGIDICKALQKTANGSSMDVNGMAVGFGGHLLFLYKADFSSRVAFVLGIGPYFHALNQKVENDGYSLILQERCYGVMLKTNLLFSLGKNVALQLGAYLSTPVFASLSLTNGVYSISPPVKLSAVNVTPFLSFSYLF